MTQATAPYDSVTLRVYYPCRFSDTVEEQASALIPVDNKRTPLPVVLLIPDVDVPQESYSWLAEALAQAGMAAVSYSWVHEHADGLVRSGPGFQEKRLSRKRFGRKPSCPALPTVLSELKKMNKRGPLAGALNLSCMVIGGHAAGGRAALLNANREWFPNLCGAFSYASHTLTEPGQGWERGDVMPLPRDMPLLLLAGTEDGVLASRLPGTGPRPETWAVEKTFADGVKGRRGDRHLVLVDGASHYTFTAPRASVTGSGFLDRRTRGRGKALRKYLAKLIVTFCDQTCRKDPMSRADLQALVQSSHHMVEDASHK
ncbi:MAG: hypothetical protein AAGI24_01610 [Pseudomonadota bacterium]